MITSGASSQFYSYVNAVIGGEVVVGELVRGAVERHVRDIDRQSTDGFPYHFDETHAAAAIDFFSLLKHSIGDYAGMGFTLEPWQAFGVGALFGWKRDDDGGRRFRSAYWSMGRKNGKSTLGAGLAILLASADVNPVTHTPEPVAEIILAATKREQAAIIYHECERMITHEPIASLCHTKNGQINFDKNAGFIRTSSTDKSHDGTNPHGMILDELHAWRPMHRSFYDTALTGFGSRSQSLRITLTTAGDDQSLLWLDEYRYAAGIARGEISDETAFSYCFELDQGDDVLDPSLWVKANPNLGVSVKPEFLQQQARVATTSAVALNRFTRYHANRIVSAIEKAFDLEAWDRCAGELSDWGEAEAVAMAADLGGRDDLAASAAVARFAIPGTETYRYEITSRAYIAEDTRRDLKKPPFSEWVYGGLLQVCKYPIADLTADVIEECKRQQISAVAYDPYNGQPFGEALAAQGIEVATFAQTTAMFNEPISDLLQAIRDGRVRHSGDPLLRWCAANAVLVRDRQDRWQYAKRDSTEKIDSIVAATMAYRMAMIAPRRPVGSLFSFGSKT